MVYDVLTHDVILSFSTTLEWPYIGIDTVSTTWTPLAGVTSVGTPTLTTSLTSIVACSTDQDTTCVQNWQLTADFAAQCDVAGTFTFAITTACRDISGVDASDDACVVQNVTFTIKSGHTDLCDDITPVSATDDATYTLVTYYDQNDDVRDSFQVGDKVFVTLTGVNPKASIDSVMVNEVKVYVLGNEAINTVIFSRDTSFTLAGVEFNHTDIETTVVAGEAIEIDLSFRLVRNLMTSTVGLVTPTTPVQLVVEVTIDIDYHGNNKRNDNNINKSASSTRIISVIAKDEETVVENGSDDIAAAPQSSSIFDSAATTIITPPIIFALVLLFVALF